eukprot:gene24251-8361_t
MCVVCVGWAALSSTSFDGDASEAYITPTTHTYVVVGAYMRGTAANSTSRPSAEKPGTILFRMRLPPELGACGVCLRSLSGYPAEEELLLPPLCVLRVASVRPDPKSAFRDDAGRPQGLVIAATVEQYVGPLGGGAGAAPFSALLDDARRDAWAASARIRLPVPVAPAAAAPEPATPPASEPDAGGDGGADDDEEEPASPHHDAEAAEQEALLR